MINWSNWFPTIEYDWLRSKSKSKKGQALLAEWVSLDTETSHNHDTENPVGWIYQWAFNFGGEVVVGRKPSELVSTLKRLIDFYHLGKGYRIVCYVHNLSYDWSYLVDWLEEAFGEGKILAIKSHKLITYTNDFFEFRCSYMLSNKSLAKWSKDLNCNHRKLEGFVVYEAIHTQEGELTAEDWAYMIEDVETLRECLERQFAMYDDNVQSTVLTSTGYIRREIKKRYKEDNHNRKRFSQTRLNATTYNLCKMEYAGGYTHGDRFLAGETVEPPEGAEIRHRDFRSHYPSQQRTEVFPIGKFNKWGVNVSRETISKLLNDYCLLIQCTITNISLKSIYTNFPYLQESKCKEGHFGKYRVLSDNGRVIEFAGTTTVCFNEHDLYWFERLYDCQVINYDVVYCSIKGYLPKFMVETVDYFMLGKTKFKDLAEREEDKEKKHDYDQSLMKSKNGLNSVYGCSSTDPIRDIIEFSDMTEWDEKRPEDIQGELDKFYNNLNNCMRFCWGCWTTSAARNELFVFAYDVIGGGVDGGGIGNGLVANNCLYMDTDSIFYISTPEIEKRIEDYNRKLRERSDRLGAFIEYEGQRVHFNQFCDEGESISKFRFLHAKCYAYEGEKKGKDFFKCTIAGVPERVIIGTDEDGKPIYYTREEELGSIDNLEVGKVFTRCGGSSISYQAHELFIYDFRGEELECASSAIISNTTKTLKHESEKHLDNLIMI